MKTNKKIIVGALALAVIASIPFIFRNQSTEIKYSTGCETYQGYRKGLDEEIFLFFDEKTMKERGEEIPNYILLGEPEWIDENRPGKNRLEIGKSYRLEIKKGLTLGSFQQCTDSEQSTQRRQ